MGDKTRRRLHNFEGRTNVPVRGWAAVFIGLLLAPFHYLLLTVGDHLRRVTEA